MYESERDFKLWDYRVSHAQLLLRSPMAPDRGTNVDVQFWGVEFVRLPTVLRGIRVRGADDPEKERDALRHGFKYPGRIFLLDGQDEALVIAAGCRVLENTIDIFESSLVSIHDNEDRSLGTVLAHSSGLPWKS